MFAVGSPKRIANKIVILVLILELVSISVWGTLSYFGSERELLNTISSKLNESAIRTSTEIGNFFDPLNAEVHAIADVATSLSLDNNEQQVLFYVLLNSRPEVEEISLIDSENIEKIRISRMQGLSGIDLRDLSNNKLLQLSRKNQRDGKLKQEMGDITFSRYSEPQINIIYPVWGGSLLLLKVNLKWLWDIVQNQVIDSSGYVYVLNEKLKLIAHPDPSHVLSDLYQRDTTVPSELFSKSSSQTLRIFSSIGNRQVAGVSHFDALHKWWIVVEQPVTEGLAPLSRVINQFISAFILTAIFSIIIVIYFSRRTMRPLEELEQGIARLASGERKVQIEVPGTTELSSLAKSFNSMASSNDQHIRGILKTQGHLENSRKALQNSERKVRVLLNSTAEAIYGIDMNGICTFCNPATLRFLGYDETEEVVGKNIDNIIQLRPTDTEKNTHSIRHIHKPKELGQGIHSDDLLICKKNGDCFHGELRAYPVMEDNNLTGAVITFIDITERYTYQKALKYQAYHDSLTDLPNRKLLHEHLDETLAKDSPYNHLALMLIDLDRFKDINDSLGHKSGDKLLKKLGTRLQTILESEDVLARLGGDEFAVFLRSKTSREDAITFAHKILTAIKEPFDLEGMQIQIDASIGIALSPDHAADGSTLMRFADVAMYFAKTKGLGFAVYNSELDVHSPYRLALLGELRNAIDENQLRLYYQPKVKMDTQEVIGFEALVRWQHPKHGLLLPDEFIPLAELGELIQPLTLWVINNAIKDRQKWRRHGLEYDVAVNVSVRSLQDLNIVEKIKHCLNSNDLSPQHLEAEITESAIMTDPVRALETLNGISELGIRIAIDDYGTGYSSLAYLKKLPLNYLKIDKSFVLDMKANENDALIVRSTIKLAHNLGLKVIAEGVESKDFWDMLEVLGCDYAQGYFISKPIPDGDVIEWGNNWSETTSLKQPCCDLLS